MPDIRLDINFFNHPKTRRLKKALGNDGVAALLELWTWAAQSRPNGNLMGLESEDIEFAANWDGEPGALVAALVKYRWIDGAPGDYRLHGWLEHNPYAAGSESRAAKNRLKALKRHHPVIYERVTQDNPDVVGLTLAEYGALIAGNGDVAYEKPKRSDEEQRIRDENAEKIVAAIAPVLKAPVRGEDMDEQTKTAQLLTSFPGKGAKMSYAVAKEWVARMEATYPEISIYDAIVDAILNVTDKNIEVRNTRRYLEAWLENTFPNTAKAAARKRKEKERKEQEG